MLNWFDTNSTFNIHHLKYCLKRKSASYFEHHQPQKALQLTRLSFS